MKYSNYNVFLPDGDRKIIYNTNSDQMLAVTADIYDLLVQHNGDVDKLQQVHPSLYKTLCEGRFIIDDGKDEYKLILDNVEKLNESPSAVHLTVNPTMDCNFRCWYCYENHNVNSKMDQITLESVKKLIVNLLSQKSITKMVLSFFGGEPLMYYKSIIQPLMQFAKQHCESIDKQLDIYFTTNGYLLSQSIINDLVTYNYVSLQIPIDGDKELHNKIKFLGDKSGTYDKVISNLKEAVNKGISVTVRCNYTADNIRSFIALIDEFSDFKDRNNLEFSFHKIWQENQTPELQEMYDEVFEAFRKEKFVSTTNAGGKGACYADYKYNMVVNYNGDVYKCTARDFNEANKLGVLNPDGIVTWSEKAAQRLECKYQSKACENCVIFPICMQGCSQNVFEATDKEGCVYGYSENQMLEIIESRIKLILV